MRWVKEPSSGPALPLRRNVGLRPLSYPAPRTLLPAAGSAMATVDIALRPIETQPAEVQPTQIVLWREQPYEDAAQRSQHGVTTELSGSPK